MDKYRAKVMTGGRRWKSGWICFIVLIVFIVPGCIKLARPAATIERHIFEYSPPALSDLSPLNRMVKVERFSVARAYNSLDIVYRPEPNTLDTYAGNRWIANPGDMVSDFLLRDLRSSKIFRAVFSYRDLEDARYVIEGSIEEILERDEAKSRSAVLTVNVTLLDLSRTGMENRVLFQKEYRISEPLKTPSPSGLAQAMSLAMARLSETVIRDIHETVQSTGP